MKEGGEILRHIKEELIKVIRVGTSLRTIDDYASSLFARSGGKAAFLGYRPQGAKKAYSASICTSINDIIVHGLPTEYAINPGDVVKLDLGMLYKGFYTDTATTILVSPVKKEVKNLLLAAEVALAEATLMCSPGRSIFDISRAIERTARQYGVYPCIGLTGHGIGRNLHEDPWIPNDTKYASKKIEIKPGMVLAIEPMFALGTAEVIELPDESYATKDSSVCVHVEHTIAITETSREVLTA
ncbi:MAG: type I methionyl aminopeptidase [Candidatus Harrisonbacteria bacterium]|nr:type I methionyl aminopeptidase [Candidatus Harrisonbacteria bacterium]